MPSSPDCEKSRPIGPTLLPDDVVPTGGIGPSLPVDLFKSKLVNQSDEYRNADRIVEDLGTIGPLLPGQELHEELRHFSSTKSDKEHIKPMSSNALKRDAWMTELLPMSRDVGALKPRKFDQRVGGQQSSCDKSWFRAPTESVDVHADDSDTESVKRRAAYEQERLASMTYDKQMESLATKTQEGKSTSSLLDLHQKQLKDKERKSVKKAKKEAKKAKKESKKCKHKSKHKKHKSSPPPNEPTRRPFDRDKDLKLSYLSTAARNELIQRSKELSGRFGHGSQQFL
ncbi:hypothetical protein CRM22_004530 [Opisthorchis felineus]|uniref:DUF3752 domain-containing protein n=1 Tax=Opisthorchis felineus TaxID=147828 RepID=A0A4S2LVQ8_OPIFE|nr:hypothetical protein CRM22_004530 [Opisthorchis felineus]